MRFYHTTALIFLVAPAICSLKFPEQQKTLGNHKKWFDTIRRALKDGDIIDEVVDDFEPQCFVTPYYGKEETPVTFGNTLEQPETKKNPALKIYCPNKKSTPGFTIALTDPDAPSRDDPKWSEMCHWLAYIYPTSDQDGVEFDLGEDIDAKELVEYKPPGPPPKTGYHRYVFILLEGDNSNLTAPEDRQHWGTGKARHGVRDWAAKEGLKVIGANYFIERNEKQ